MEERGRCGFRKHQQQPQAQQFIVQYSLTDTVWFERRAGVEEAVHEDAPRTR